MTTVVEGVEDTAQLDFLRRHGCPLAQGFLLSRPAEPGAVAAMLTASSALAVAS